MSHQFGDGSVKESSGSEAAHCPLQSCPLPLNILVLLLKVLTTQSQHNEESQLGLLRTGRCPLMPHGVGYCTPLLSQKVVIITDLKCKY